MSNEAQIGSHDLTVGFVRLEEVPGDRYKLYPCSMCKKDASWFGIGELAKERMALCDDCKKDLRSFAQKRSGIVSEIESKVR